jgi:hypothetical protein
VSGGDVRSAIKEFGADIEIPKPKARRRPCGCVIGYEFCDGAKEAWLMVGLAHSRGDLHAYAEALNDFGEHVPSRFGEPVQRSAA